jgi:hypothetical protein
VSMCSWLGFLVFFLPTDDMNGRTGGACSCAIRVHNASAPVTICFLLNSTEYWVGFPSWGRHSQSCVSNRIECCCRTRRLHCGAVPGACCHPVCG